MDNLTKRRLLAFVGIAVITVGIVVMAYGLFTGNNAAQLLGLAGIVLAYIITVLVRRLRKASEQKGRE